MFKRITQLAIIALLPISLFADNNSICEKDKVTTPEYDNAIVTQIFPDGTAKAILTDGVLRGNTYSYSVRNFI